jgi:hypothetical protein
MGFMDSRYRNGGDARSGTSGCEFAERESRQGIDEARPNLEYLLTERGFVWICRVTELLLAKE